MASQGLSKERYFVFLLELLPVLLFRSFLLYLGLRLNGGCKLGVGFSLGFLWQWLCIVESLTSFGRINEAFFHFDPDKDGYISVEDLVVVMMTKGAKMSAQEAQEFAREVDFDNDGHVYYPEVADYLLSGE
jgi:hypothetical protein